MDATPENLDPHHLDDGILSALLDGDSAGTGADGGPDATAHLSACDRCAGRQAELGAARAALAAAAVETLDELTRRRLVAAALAAGADGRADTGLPDVTARGTSTAIGRSRRFQRHPALLGSAAAVLLALLVGVPFVVGDGGGQDETTLSAQAPEASREESAGSFLGDLGDLTDRDSLRLRLSGAAADATLGYSAPKEPGPSTAAGAPAAAPVPVAGQAGGGSLSGPPAGERSSGISSTTASDAAKSSAENSTADAREPHRPPSAESDGFSSDQQSSADRDRVDTDTCVAALLDGPARGGRLTHSGVGTYQGRPAIVASFELEGGTVAFITDRSGCAVLDRFPM